MRDLITIPIRTELIQYGNSIVVRVTVAGHPCTEHRVERTANGVELVRVIPPPPRHEEPHEWETKDEVP